MSAAERHPWPDEPPPETAKPAPTPGPTGWLMDFYAQRLSNVDAVRTCRFQPSCGEYAQEAIRRHGWLLGWIMGCERALRWHGDRRTYRRTLADGHVRFLDALDDNDFWFPRPLQRKQPSGSSRMTRMDE